MKIIIDSNLEIPEKNIIEIVERKGIGHPDTIADSLAERVSIDYSKYCLENFGIILHHNLDKLCALGGLLKINDWGNAEMQKPFRIVINGRVSKKFGSKVIPFESIAREAIIDQFKQILPGFEIENWLEIIDQTTTYSRNPKWFNPDDKNDLPESKQLNANDTSTVVSYWPLTLSEQVTLKMENYFYVSDRKPKYKFIGHDIKVMVIRKENFVEITLCVPFLVNLTPSYDFYTRKLKLINKDLTKIAIDHFGKKYEVKINLNNQDTLINKNQRKYVQGHYLNISGSALDYGEEGVVGRGNNRAGIIPSFRPYTMEAAWGKNPVYHVGKVVGYVMDELAKEISSSFNCSVSIICTSVIGDSLFSPRYVSINTSKKIDKIKAEKIVREFLGRESEWTRRIIFENALIPKTNK